jgi:hypothetical protein
MELEYLKQALDNDQNNAIYDETNASIVDKKRKVLSQFDLSRTKIADLMEKLQNYRYVEDLNDLRTGAYLRWVYIGDEENDNEFFDDDNQDFHLNKGALFCETKVEADGLYIICKTYQGKFFQFPMNGDYLFFQKLSAQEQTILNTIDAVASIGVGRGQGRL